MIRRPDHLVLAVLVSLALAPAALGGGFQRPGSLLVFPIFENTRATFTFITVTNDADVTPNGGTRDVDQLRVEYVYIRHEDQFLPSGELNPLFPLDCTEFNRTRILTPHDTLTVATRLDNPGAHRGYVYVFAKQGNAAGTSAIPIKWNHLLGQVHLWTSGFADTEMNAITYEAIGGTATSTTDTNANQQRDLDGIEYQKTPDVLEFPRFQGQGTGGPGGNSDLIVIALTGGSQFTTLIDLSVYNDNEEVFSANDTVRCWSSKPLNTISSAFSNVFLLSTNHALGEHVGTVGFDLETGWFKARGLVATSQSTTIPNGTPGTTENPAILAVLLERSAWGQSFGLLGLSGMVLPYGSGADNGGGSLLPHSQNGL